MTEVEGAENQVASSRGSPGCEGFRSVFACFNYPVLKFWPIGLSAVTFPWAAISPHRAGAGASQTDPLPRAHLPVNTRCQAGLPFESLLASPPQPKQLRSSWARDPACTCRDTTGSRALWSETAGPGCAGSWAAPLGHLGADARAARRCNCCRTILWPPTSAPMGKWRLNSGLRW